MGCLTPLVILSLQLVFSPHPRTSTPSTSSNMFGNRRSYSSHRSRQIPPPSAIEIQPLLKPTALSQNQYHTLRRLANSSGTLGAAIIAISFPIGLFIIITGSTESTGLILAGIGMILSGLVVGLPLIALVDIAQWMVDMERHCRSLIRLSEDKRPSEPLED